MQIKLIGPIGNHALCEERRVSETHSIFQCAIGNCIAFEDFTTGDAGERLRAIREVSQMKCNPS